MLGWREGESERGRERVLGRGGTDGGMYGRRREKGRTEREG